MMTVETDLPHRPSRRRANRRAWLAGAAAAAVAMGMAGGAFGQALERHLPPAELPKAEAPAAPEAPSRSTDATPLGAATLTSLVLLGPSDVPASNPPPEGVDAHAVARMDTERSRALLRKFLGRPMSRQLISEVEAAIVKDYRAMGYPFVQVSTPQQEIDSGVLQIRVVEFHLGKIETRTASPGEAAHIDGQIRIKPGQPIDSPALVEDFDWLSRYPFRTVTPAFTPGAGLGETDLDLKVADSKPWQVSAGYNNSGSQETGWDRYFLAATVGVPQLNDLVLSMQVTGSSDFWARQWVPFNDGHAAYESVAARVTAPTVAREDVELTVDAVQSFETVNPFTIRQRTLEATLAYRSALSNFVPLPGGIALGDVAVGVEAIRQNRTTYFGPFEVLDELMDVFQLYGEWSYRWADPYGHSAIDLKVHGSPGGLDPENTAGDFLFYTNGRVTTAAYAYGEVNFSRVSILPRGFSLATQLTAQYAGQPIPDPEQIGIGGFGAVRGYSLDDGAFDDGVILRNEVHTNPYAVPIPTRDGKAITLMLSPMVFFDAGYGRNEATRQGVAMASAGFGADAQLTRFLSGGLTLSCPLTNAKDTRSGAWRLDARVSVAY